jgi:hypothetical protein
MQWYDFMDLWSKRKSGASLWEMQPCSRSRADEATASITFSKAPYRLPRFPRALCRAEVRG